MSNFLAIATVTEALRLRLHSVVSADVGEATATKLRPSALATTSTLGVNVFLYQVMPNSAHRNADLPTRNGSGGLVHQPCAAIDLHYLLSFYGNEDEMVPQRALGSVLIALHQQPVLLRRDIRSAVESSSALGQTGGDSGAGAEPANPGAKVISDLADAVESVRFTQLPLSLEEMAKLWSVFFQAPYVLSVAFQAGPVLIDARATPAATLPVRERAVHVATFRHPRIAGVAPADDPRGPITATSTLRISGSSLLGEATGVRVDGLPMGPLHATSSDSLIDVTLPAALRAGVHGLQVVHGRLVGEPAAPRGAVESNTVPFVLQPLIEVEVSGVDLTTGVPHTGMGGETLYSAALTVHFLPSVARTQRVKLLLYEAEPSTTLQARAYVFDAPRDNGITADEGSEPAAETAGIEFAVHHVVAATYLVRVQVDGAESSLEWDSAAGAYSGPQVRIP